MNNFEFYSSIIKHWDVYLFSFLLCFIIYYITYKHVFLSLLDPLNLNILFSFLGASVVFFLFFLGKINTYYFSSYCLTQISFTIGFFVFKPIKKKAKRFNLNNELKIKDELLFLELVFIISSLLHLGCQLYVYIIRGIPLFMTSYLETFNVGGGFGILNRIIVTSSIISWYLVIHFLLNGKGKGLTIYIWIYIIISFGFFILSGSKGTFLTIGFILFIYSLINSRFNLVIQNLRKKIDKFSLGLFLIVCAMVLVIIFIKTTTGVSPLIGLGIRLIHSGDAYFYGYPNGAMEHLVKGNPFYALFSDILGMSRVVNWEQLPQSFGLLLLRYHYPSIDWVAGANARHNIFGLFYFGYIGSIVFSFFLGLLVSFCRNYLYHSLPRNTFMGLLFTLLYLSVCAFESDICLALFLVDSYFLSSILIIGISLSIFYLMKLSLYKQQKFISVKK